MKDDLKDLNPSQRDAVLHFDGPALVLAGPGSGKTSVLTRRIRCLIERHHVPPEKILVVTFTKAAAVQMQSRFFYLVKGKLPVRFGTFHAVFYHMLRESSPHSSLTFLKEKEKWQIMEAALKKEGVHRRNLSFCIEEISRLKNIGSGWENEIQEKEELNRKKFLEIFREYRKICTERGKIDFDDMAFEVLLLIKNNGAMLERWQREWSYILVDEYQDINPIQEEILFMLALPENNLFLVGDDDQSIYGFRGAGSGRMLSFPKRFPRARKIFLNINYRSRPEIIEAAGKVIRENKERYDKTQLPGRIFKERDGEILVIKSFSDKKTEYAELINCLKNEKERGQTEQTAVLYRKNSDMEYLLRLLEKEGIPFWCSEKRESIWEHFVAQDICAYLRLIFGEKYRSDFYRVMDRPFRGISREAVREEKISFHEVMEFHKYDESVIKTVKKWEKDCLMAQNLNLYGAVMYIRKGMGYETYLTENYPAHKKEECFEILRHIQNEAREVPDFSLWERHVEKQKKKEEEIKRGQEKNQAKGVRLMTYHAAKGLEFDCCILPDLNEGCVPHTKAVSQKEIEEERRMFYVAMTRAKEKLCLYYRTGTKEEPETMSRFLKPLV